MLNAFLCLSSCDGRIDYPREELCRAGNKKSPAITEHFCFHSVWQEILFRFSATSVRRWSTMTAPRQSTSSTVPSTYRTCARRRCWSNLMVSRFSLLAHEVWQCLSRGPNVTEITELCMLDGGMSFLVFSFLYALQNRVHKGWETGINAQSEPAKSTKIEFLFISRKKEGDRLETRDETENTSLRENVTS